MKMLSNVPMSEMSMIDLVPSASSQLNFFIQSAANVFERLRYKLMTILKWLLVMVLASDVFPPNAKMFIFYVSSFWINSSLSNFIFQLKSTISSRKIWKNRFKKSSPVWLLTLTVTKILMKSMLRKFDICIPWISTNVVIAPRTNQKPTTLNSTSSFPFFSCTECRCRAIVPDSVRFFECPNCLVYQCLYCRRHATEAHLVRSCEDMDRAERRPTEGFRRYNRYVSCL